MTREENKPFDNVGYAMFLFGVYDEKTPDLVAADPDVLEAEVVREYSVSVFPERSYYRRDESGWSAAHNVMFPMRDTRYDGQKRKMRPVDRTVRIGQQGDGIRVVYPANRFEYVSGFAVPVRGSDGDGYLQRNAQPVALVDMAQPGGAPSLPVWFARDEREAFESAFPLSVQNEDKGNHGGDDQRCFDRAWLQPIYFNHVPREQGYDLPLARHAARQ